MQRCYPPLHSTSHQSTSTSDQCRSAAEPKLNLINAPYPFSVFYTGARFNTLYSYCFFHAHTNTHTYVHTHIEGAFICLSYYSNYSVNMLMRICCCCRVRFMSKLKGVVMTVFTFSLPLFSLSFWLINKKQRYIESCVKLIEALRLLARVKVAALFLLLLCL